jgi:serine/threonine-protein kinase HipA
MPASGIGGDWIVKLPDRFFPEVPRNEFTMMSLARDVGIDVPEIRMVHRDEVVGLPSGVWPDQEEWAYTVRRFDRDDRHGLIHIEDLAQVRNVYPDDKYRGNFETVGSLIYRGRDVDSLREYCRRLVFSILISNGDAHLKNWSLIYRDPRIPALAPAYDLVSTRYYMGTDEEFGLRFGGTKRYERIRLSAFDRLERRIGSDAGLADTGRALIKAMLARWPDRADSLRCADGLRRDIDASITQRSATLAGS